LVYSTYLGGSDFDWAEGIAVDATGNAYVTGQTESSDFPTTAGAFDTSFNGHAGFVTKIDATGAALVYSTYLRDGMAQDIAIDASGAAYVTGAAGPNFPTTAGAFDTTSDSTDAFVMKLDPTGAALAYSTFLGGSQYDLGNSIAVDASGS